MLAKLVPIFLLFVANIVVALLDYKWHDKRTIKFRRARFSLLVVIIPALSIGTVIAVVVDDRTHAREVRMLEELRQNADNDAALAASRAERLDGRAEMLLSENRKMREAIEPLTSEIRQHHPSASDPEILLLLRTEVGALASRTTKLEVQGQPASLVLRPIDRPSRASGTGDWTHNIDVVPDRKAPVLGPIISLRFRHPYKTVSWRVMPEQLGSMLESVMVSENPQKTEYSLSFGELKQGRWLRFVIGYGESNSGEVKVDLAKRP